MTTVLGQTWTFNSIYRAWAEMPLLIRLAQRGMGEGIKKKKSESTHKTFFGQCWPPPPQEPG